MKLRIYHESCDYDYFSERIACGEELMHLLLDRGASARDAIIPRRGGGDGQPLHTVLGWAVCRSSYGLVKRLLDEGTDVHRRKQYMNGYSGATWETSAETRSQCHRATYCQPLLEYTMSPSATWPSR